MKHSKLLIADMSTQKGPLAKQLANIYVRNGWAIKRYDGKIVISKKTFDNTCVVELFDQTKGDKDYREKFLVIEF